MLCMVLHCVAIAKHALLLLTTLNEWRMIYFVYKVCVWLVCRQGAKAWSTAR